MITVVYYTANNEEEIFEQKTREKLAEAIGDLPLISISHKPIDFGHNICVGDIGMSDENILKQMLIGCELADTPLIAIAESDGLYPPTGYFDFRPDIIDAVYRYTNLWVLQYGWGHYRKKAFSICAQVAGRKYLIERLKLTLGPPLIRRKDIVNMKTGWKPFESSIPCLNIKTGNSQRPKTGTIKGMLPETSLPHWGKATDLENELRGINA